MKRIISLFPLRPRVLVIGLCLVTTALLMVATPYVLRLDRIITETFNGQRWALPAVVYARPLELYPGLPMNGDMVERELLLAGYRREQPVQGGGGYLRRDRTIELVTRPFAFPDGVEPSTAVTLSFDTQGITRITDSITGEPVLFQRLDPARIGSFHPLIHEDRIVLQPHGVPPLLHDALLAVEDRRYYRHHGIAPLAIFRALLANLRAGRTVQGGSTITQQLVKNFFLNHERTLARKAKEALMALLLELHFSKEDILTTYVNEVFLGQDGNRAIHGFALASQFYFRRALEDLSIAQTATLVGLVKGPSYYDPRRHPQRCLQRRSTVLHQLQAAGIITETAFQEALSEPLADVAPQQNGFNRFPAFIAVVKRQLAKHYRQEDLEQNGLRIMTTLDPLVQWTAEKQMAHVINELERRDTVTNLEGAMVITARESGEVQAVLGGRDPLQAGFNRALDSRRQIGSLVKPVVYLAALDRGFTLASPLLDRKITVDTPTTPWRPRNYDGREHGIVPLYAALAHSYNLATVRLGLELGLEPVLSTLKHLGYDQPVAPYPAVLLGAIDMSVLQVAQFYQTIASGGFYVPLRAIRGVISPGGRLLNRYGLEVHPRFDPALIYLLTHALERVMTEGTGSNGPAATPRCAGKTGTSDATRDSWFAGFCQNRLAIAWMGRDDNKPTTVTGASGALKVWAETMSSLQALELEQIQPQHIRWKRIDTATLKPASIFSTKATRLPFLARGLEEDTGQGPALDMQTVESKARQLLRKLENIFN